MSSDKHDNAKMQECAKEIDEFLAGLGRQGINALVVAQLPCGCACLTGNVPDAHWGRLLKVAHDIHEDDDGPTLN